MWPWPQVVEQSLQLVYVARWQSIGQGTLVLHTRTSVPGLQATPPKALIWSMARRLTCVPSLVPQVTEHWLQPVQPPMEQSIGQLWKLQSCDSERAGQAAPFSTCVSVMLRVRLWVPPPQLFVHVSQSDQSLTRQCSSHVCVLHARCESRSYCAHASPPLASWRAMPRVFSWVPPLPHCWVHVDQVDQPVSWQSTGQASVLQDSVSVSEGHGMPPATCWWSPVRVLVRVPPPQV